MDLENEIETAAENHQPPPQPKKNERSDAAAERIARTDDKSIVEYFSDMTAGASVQLKIKRLSPRTFRGRPVSGLVETVDELLSEEEIQARHGGGKYELKCFRTNSQGKQVFAGQRTIEIAGNPNLRSLPFVGDEEEATVAPLPAEDSSLQKHALSLAAQTATEERRRAERLQTEMMEMMRSGTSLDPELLKVLSGPLQTQVQALQQQLTERDRQVQELLAQRGAPTTADRILESMLREEQSRLAAMRAAHEAEIRTVRESMLQDVKHERERSDRMLENAERNHQREVDNLRASHAQALESLKISYETRIDSLKSDLERVRGDLHEARTEVNRLRDKKEKPFEEQLADIVRVKELVGSLDSRDDAEEDNGVMGLIRELAGPLAGGIGARIAGPAAAIAMAEEPQAPQEAPQAVPQARPKAAPRPVAQVPAKAQGAPQKVKALEIDPAEFASAISFIEEAIRSDTDPKAFAASARNLVPASILEFIRAQGVDTLIDSVAKRNGNSPIATQAGRNFVRSVVKELSHSG